MKMKGGGQSMVNLQIKGIDDELYNEIKKARKNSDMPNPL
jgi:hypothetical protein